jgi:hypothetical protein
LQWPSIKAQPEKGWAFRGACCPLAKSIANDKMELHKRAPFFTKLSWTTDSDYVRRSASSNAITYGIYQGSGTTTIISANIHDQGYGIQIDGGTASATSSSFHSNTPTQSITVQSRTWLSNITIGTLLTGLAQ